MQRKLRYFPDGRDLNRQFPGNPKGSTTRRVANRLWNHIFSQVDGIIDLHSAAKGRTNVPSDSADLAHPESNLLAKTFGIEVILDSTPPKGSPKKLCRGRHTVHNLRRRRCRYNRSRVRTDSNQWDHQQPSLIENDYRKAKASKFRLLASGTTWIRTDHGGLLDMHVKCGSIMREGDIIATLADPAHPGQVVEILAPEDGLMISSAINPFVTAGMPVAHFYQFQSILAYLKIR